jgi:hypothetical protein
VDSEVKRRRTGIGWNAEEVGEVEGGEGRWREVMVVVLWVVVVLLGR